MQQAHLDLLVCPNTGRSLELKDADIVDGRIRTGTLVEPDSGVQYPIVDFIPRFVPPENYAGNFGIQWNIHDRTQYDDSSGFNASAERFEKETKWRSDLAGNVMLEMGSGSGRFTTEALKTGATVASFDLSNAVEANYKSNGQHENLLLVQASIYEMPFRKASFDRAFCFGVIQHTPDPHQSFLSMVEMVKPGGHVASDIYRKDFFRWALATKYWVRPFTRNMDAEKLYPRVKKYVDLVWPLVRFNRKIPKLGNSINWRLLVADDSKIIPGAPDHVLKEWSYLNTYDMLAPKYDIPASVNTFKKWHEEAGLQDIEVHKGYNGVEGRGTKST